MLYIFIGINGNKWITYEKYLKEECEKLNIKIDFLEFPVNENCKFANWKNTMDKYLTQNLINEQTIVVSRCLGSRFIVKYAAMKKLKFKSLICIASSFKDDITKENFKEIWKDFKVYLEEISQMLNYIEYRFSIYGDCDHLFSKDVLEYSADLIKAEKVFVKDLNHCGNSSGVEKLPQVIEIIKKLQVDK